MSTFYTYRCTVDSRDTDLFGQCRPSALLGELQQAATGAACALHVSRDETLEAYHAFWMLVRMWYRLERPLYWDEALEIRTWHRGGRGASTYRDYDLYVDGKWVGEGVSTWVLADQDTHRLVRMAGVKEFAGTDGGELCKDKLLGRVRLPGGMALAGQREMHYSDTDVNGHVNNTRYADFVCDALHLERVGEGQFVSSLQVGFLSECRAGEVLDLYTGLEDGVHYVHGTGSGGDSRFDAALTLSPLPQGGARP